MGLNTSELINGYEAIALVYSRTMAEDFCQRALPIYRQILLRDLPSGALVLDICCGSGQLARELTRIGYRVTGLDASIEMIRLASAVAPQARFVVADARNFRFTSRFSAGVSSFNSLAHAASFQELLQIFTNARHALAPGAPLVFDLSMEEAYSSRWHGRFSADFDGTAVTIEPSFDPQTRVARNDIRIANQDGSSLHDESHRGLTIYQHCHTEDEVRHAVHVAGFRNIESFDAEEQLDMIGEQGRRFFRCY